MAFEVTDNTTFENIKDSVTTDDNLDNAVSILVLRATDNVVVGNRAFQLNIDKLKNFFPIAHRNVYNDKYKCEFNATVNDEQGTILLRPYLQSSTTEYVQITFTGALQSFKMNDLIVDEYFCIIKFKDSNIYKVYKSSYSENKLAINTQLIATDSTNFNLSPSETSTDNIYIQKIYFGSPGTGKSKQADNDTLGSNVEKTTFHPEYDYNTFVGSYKPVMNDDGDSIEYKFVPQIFSKVYVQAWKNPEKNYFLLIEEINRGNCAEIFGDLFQLLDRNDDGVSEYGVTVNEDLLLHLKKEFQSDTHPGIIDGTKIKLPANFSLIATMNTSDQSLFPMDSAFKRRWEWEYIPITYEKGSASDFKIELTNGKSYSWLEFLSSVNKKILLVTHSQDKQLGNWFINATNNGGIINEKSFINKVIFYLWNDVFKDEEETIFIDSNEEIIEGKLVTYEHFFTNNENSILIEMILKSNLGLISLNEQEESNSEVEELSADTNTSISETSDSSQ